jgi:hypothetical protein
MTQDALRHAARMSLAIDELATALYGARYKHRSPEPEAAGKALTELLNAKRDYDRAILLATEEKTL